MNCLKCNKELKEGAKFCTSCGTPVQQPSSELAQKGDVCPKCQATLKSGAKFCTSCGTPIAAANTPAPAPASTPAPAQTPANDIAQTKDSEASVAEGGNNMSVVKQKIVWNVLPGEIARTIKESEFAEYDSATGLIVDDGTTAVFRANNTTIAQVHGGSYDFLPTKELERIVKARPSGTSPIKRGFSAFFGMILGKKANEPAPVEEVVDTEKLKSVDAIAKCLQDNQPFSLTLRLDRDFDLVIGAAKSTPDECAAFEPMVIKSKHLDLKVGVHAIFKIADIDLFIKHYLGGDRRSVTTAYLANELAPIIKSAISSVMGDLDLASASIPAELMGRIKNSINAEVSKSLYGISIENILEITVEEESLERFRALSRELYLSEQELDFLVRSDDLKNRMNLQVDEQIIFEACRENDRERALMEINRDGLLTEDEMEKFKLQLQLERSIREARTNEEYQQALDEIEANGFQRVHSLNLAKRRAQAELDELDIKRNRTVRVTNAETDVMEREIVDNYELEKKRREHALNEQKADSAIDRLRRMKEMERDDKTHSHNLEMEREREANEAHLRDLELKANLSPQQLMALASEKNMDSAAAQKLAESFSAGMDMQQQKEFMESFNKMNQSRIDDQMANADRMERMMNRMMDMTSSMAGNIGREQESMKNEYRDRLQHQESRLDSTMERSLDYTTKSNAIDQSAAPQQGATTYMVDVDGIESQIQSLPQVTLLIKKGKVGANTLIFSSATQDWIEAYRYSEFSNLLSAAPQPQSGKSCPSCGAVNGESDMFCNSCGQKI